jgi:hypothetical protein
MHPDYCNNLANRITAQGARERRRYNFSAGLVFSVALHTLALSTVIAVLAMAAKPDDAALVIPVDIVQLADETAGPLAPDKGSVPQQETAPPSSPAARSADLSPLEKRPPPDDLEIKLRNLAQLRQPIVDTNLSEKGDGLALTSVMRQGAALRSDAAIKDFLRDQIEHHWGLDLATLSGRNISVLIRVAITNAGVITKAEIVNSSEIGIDPVYDEIASSARDAALLSSPLTLPPGYHAGSMDVIISLNTRDALR